jgi:Uma2 family endonuclease
MTLMDPPIVRKAQPVRRGWRQPVERTNGSAKFDVRLTVDQYHAMIAKGIIEEGAPIELLAGRLYWKDRSVVGEDPMSVGTGHAWVIRQLTKLDGKLSKYGCHIQVQLPITLSSEDEPEPDGVIVRGSPEDFIDKHPGPEDILCLIEAADSSLGRDRGIKLRTYAQHGLPLYIIVNLIDRVIEVYTLPSGAKPGHYGDLVSLDGAATIALPTAKRKKLNVAAKTLLPPASKRRD